MKHHYGWIIILLGALVVAGCEIGQSPKSKEALTDSSIVVYRVGLTDVRKIKVDGQEYLVVWSPNGVAITRHDKPIEWIPNGGGTITIDSVVYEGNSTITTEGSAEAGLWKKGDK